MSVGLVITLLLCLFAIIFIPGWAFLSLTRIGRKWPALQQWILATAISLSFLPVLFYFARFLLPNLHIGRNKIILMLVLFIGLIFVGQWRIWKTRIVFTKLEWVALLVFLGTIFIRLLLAYRYPYPAWSDSLHHTLITQLTALTGQLPYSLAPYEPSILNMYHLGLYSISGTVQILSGAPAHTALLWTVQFINGLAGIGVYFVLDRLIGPKAGIIGALTVGFYSFQPNWYFNWGRDTQLSSQTIMLVAWLFTWETIRLIGKTTSLTRLENWGSVLAAALMNAAVFLFHFRVAGYYLALLFINVLYELVISIQDRTFARKTANIVVIGILSLVLISPVLIPSFNSYLEHTQTNTDVVVSQDTPPAEKDYFAYTFDTIYSIGARKWMVWLIAAATLINIFVFPKWTIGILLWMAVLWAEGNAYRLGIPVLNFTNYTAIMIMFYIPIGLLLGMAGEALFKVPWLKPRGAQAVIMGILFLLGIVSANQRINDIEPLRFFVTAADVEAMDWIRVNTAEDAVFGINTFMWLGSSPHGTDGGYWIPYFANRMTTTGTMLYGLADSEYIDRVLNQSKTIVESAKNTDAIAQLGQLGVNYIYIGPKGNFSGQGLNPDIIGLSPNAKLVYSQNDVEIFKIIP